MPYLTDEQIAELKEYADDLDAARREGVIEGRAQAEAEMQSKIDAAVAREREVIEADVNRLVGAVRGKRVNEYVQGKRDALDQVLRLIRARSGAKGGLG